MSGEGNPLAGEQIILNGIVQGVGFRPAVYRIARKFGLTGTVRNSSHGVVIRVFSSQQRINQFFDELLTHLPVMARLDSWSRETIPWQDIAEFTISRSDDQAGSFLPVSPDLATCSACHAEILDPANRRYHYPFTNCTQCGPRFSILASIPYDRDNTSMRNFKLCPECSTEYHDPADRRFHAQPTACSRCGPELTLLSGNAEPVRGESASSAAAAAITNGEILALKGLGGYHLACDARNAAAVETLRRRKHRSMKPFALMAKNLAAAEKVANLSEEEAGLMACASAPIVILERKNHIQLPAALAPNQNTLGIMLPYTPLHILLFEYLEIDLLVMTSSNFSDEPLIYSDHDSDIQKMRQLADRILTHNRPIVNRIDDSVLQRSPVPDQPVLLRRARGFAPKASWSEAENAQILAVGADLKNTFCLTRDHYRVLSHHIGDIENLETYEAFTRSVDHYETLFRCQPQAIACDLHPNFYTTRYAELRSEPNSLPLFRIQHHHAHIASVLADHGRFNEQPVIGLAMDGTGYGSDGTIWGGEILLCSCRGFTRLMHLEPFRIPASDEAIREPAIQAIALLSHYQIPLQRAEILFRSLKGKNPRGIDLLIAALNSGTNCVLTSSLGRLFDCVAALTGVCLEATYEGQAAIELEAVSSSAPSGAYRFAITDNVFSPQPAIAAILEDLESGIPAAVISGRFHQALINAFADICDKIRETSFGNRDQVPVALSGGVWQNRILLKGVCNMLQKNNFEVLIPRTVPFNDGCIAFGQAAIANMLLKER